MTTAAPLTLHFPGPRHTDRRQRITITSTAVTATLRPGARLLDALTEAADQNRIHCAQIELMGGLFERISYCVPTCGRGENPVSYSETHEATVPAQLLSASVTLGFRDGRRFMHCHALWLEADGTIRAGHLWPESTIGAVPPYAVMHTLPGVTMLSEDDCETKMPAFTPKSNVFSSTADVGGSRAVICRVLPGEDIIGATEIICEKAGITHGVMRASLGSLVGACLHRSDEEHLVDGPATEIITLAGSIGPDPVGFPQATASAVVVDRHGQVHAGPLVRGRNPVAVTLELLIIEQA